MPNTIRVPLGNIKIGLRGDLYIAHLFFDGEFVVELATIHASLVLTPTDYEKFKDFVVALYSAMIKDKVPGGVGTLEVENIRLTENSEDLN